jgi:integrase
VSPYKPNQGSYEIDRIFPQIGRVRIRTGVFDADLANRYEVMLEMLPLSVVQLIADKRLPIRVAFDAWARGDVAGLPTAATLLPLADELARWLEKPALEVGPSEAASRHRTAEYLLGLRSDAAVKDLAGVLRELGTLLEGATFNRSRAAVLAFVRDRFATNTALRDEVAAVPASLERRIRAHHPQTVDQARSIAATLGEKWGPIWWTLCITGMGPKEFWIDGWRITSDGVEINGAKDTRRRRTTARQRIVPILGKLAQPIGTMAGFAEALERAELGVTPYDARRSFGRWLDDAGLSGYLQDALMGHGPKSMRELYKWGEIRSMLGEAKEAMLRKLGAVPQLSRSSGTEGS